MQPPFLASASISYCAWIVHLASKPSGILLYQSFQSWNYRYKPPSLTLLYLGARNQNPGPHTHEGGTLSPELVIFAVTCITELPGLQLSRMSELSIALLPYLFISVEDHGMKTMDLELKFYSCCTPQSYSVNLK